MATPDATSTVSILPQCATCRHWLRDSTVGTQLGNCNAPFVHSGYSALAKVETPPDGILVEDDEGWGWLTGEAFGCIHHEARP